ncbi:hypothetical protein M8494_16720 [Serratia ureilytica]
MAAGRNWPQVNCLYADLYRPETRRRGAVGRQIRFTITGCTRWATAAVLSRRSAGAAPALRDALRNAGVKQVIFLGALQPNDDSSPHLAARRLTGEILRQSGVPVTELRAGIIVGPGSAAFSDARHGL